MFGLGSQELLVILVIVLILFGANRLPQLARSLGSSMKEFKKGIDEGKGEDGRLRPCRSCQNPLAVDWSHCPRCGTPVAQGPAIHTLSDLQPGDVIEYHGESFRGDPHCG